MFGSPKKTVILTVAGMKCPHCAASVKAALEKIRGVKAEIDLEKAEAAVSCPEKTDADALAAAVTEAGFPASVKA